MSRTVAGHDDRRWPARLAGAGVLAALATVVVAMPAEAAPDYSLADTNFAGTQIAAHEGGAGQCPRRRGRADARARRQRAPGPGRLARRGRRRREVHLRQGDRGHRVPQPAVRRAVRRRARGGPDPRRVPLRPAGRLRRRGAGGVLHHPRRRLARGRQDPAGRAGHRVQPVRRRLLRQEPGRHDGVDHGLHADVPGEGQAQRADLHEHVVVEGAAPATPTGSATPIRCGWRGTARRSASCRRAGTSRASGSSPAAAACRGTRTTTTGRWAGWRRWRRASRPNASSRKGPATAAGAARRGCRASPRRARW